MQKTHILPWLWMKKLFEYTFPVCLSMTSCFVRQLNFNDLFVASELCVDFCSEPGVIRLVYVM